MGRAADRGTGSCWPAPRRGLLGLAVCRRLVDALGRRFVVGRLLGSSSCLLIEELLVVGLRSSTKDGAERMADGTDVPRANAAALLRIHDDDFARSDQPKLVD